MFYPQGGRALFPVYLAVGLRSGGFDGRAAGGAGGNGRGVYLT